MGDLTKRIIEKVKAAKTCEDFQDWAWMAGDLLKKSHYKRYHSGFSETDPEFEIDREVVSPDEAKELQTALLDALSRNSEPRFVSQIIQSLDGTHDESLKQLYIDYLAAYLKALKHCNSVMYATMIALDNIDEPVFERRPDGSSSMAVNEIDENIRQAERYLVKNGMTVLW